MLYVQKLVPHAIVPTIAHPGEDLAYDLYASEDTWLVNGGVVKVPTGIAAVYRHAVFTAWRFGLLVRDRSSVALSGAWVVAGMVDAGYHGEICVVMHYAHPSGHSMQVLRGQKIAQMMPIQILADEVAEIDSLDTQFPASRGQKGWGSSGTGLPPDLPKVS